MRRITTSKGVIKVGSNSVPMKKMDCSSDIDILPKLPGCPADDEYFLVTNAKYGYGSNGHALRAWGDIKVCVGGGDNPDPEPEPGVDTNTNIANAELVFDAVHTTNLNGFKWEIYNGEKLLVIGSLPAVVTEPTDFLVIDKDTLEIKRRANPAWDLLGNTGTDPAINFIGTTDAKDIVFRTNNTEKLRVVDRTFTRIDTTMDYGFYVNSGGDNTYDKTFTGTIAISGDKNRPALSSVRRRIGENSHPTSNIGIGPFTGHTVEDGMWNVMMGYWTGSSLHPFGEKNILVGTGHFMSWGPGNTATYECSQNCCFGNFNLQFGGYYGACIGNVSMGSENLVHAGEVRDSIVIGVNNAREHSQCKENIYMGANIAWRASTASRNIILAYVDPGDENGNYAAIQSTDSDNIGIGYRIYGQRGGGNKGITIGSYAGSNHTPAAQRMRGTGNIHIGYNSGSTSNTTINAVIVGTCVGPVDTNGNGQINISNILYGINGYTDTVTISNAPTAIGSIGIGVQVPGGRLHLGASSLNRPSLRFDVGVDPNTINASDVWFDGTNIRMKQVALNTITNASSMTVLNIVSANGLLLPLFDNAGQATMTPVKGAVHINSNANRPIYYDGTTFKTVAFTDDTFTVTSVPEDNADGGDANTVYGGGLFIDGGTA